MRASKTIDLENVWVARLHLRSTADSGIDHEAIEAWCIDRGWAGVGWGLWKGADYAGISWQRYVEEYGGQANPSVRLLRELPLHSLVWTRRKDGTYWLGMITGRWRYRDGPSAQQLDMFNVRPCRWLEVGVEDLVPGKIVNNFRASKTLNPVSDWAASEYSKRLYARLAGWRHDLADSEPEDIVRSLLGATDLEDLVAAYLQVEHGLVLVSRRPSTAGYEYVLRDPKNGRKAVASVKSGGDPVDLDALPKKRDADVWAYAVENGKFTGKPRRDIRWISTGDLTNFIRSHPTAVPEQVVQWLKPA